MAEGILRVGGEVEKDKVGGGVQIVVPRFVDDTQAAGLIGGGGENGVGFAKLEVVPWARRIHRAKGVGVSGWLMAGDGGSRSPCRYCSTGMAACQMVISV